jgi:hypothetical protein
MASPDTIQLDAHVFHCQRYIPEAKTMDQDFRRVNNYALPISQQAYVTIQILHILLH